MRSIAGMVTVMLACGALQARPQQDAAEPSSIPLRVIVTDARGHSVPGLTAADIEITEGERQQTIQSISFRNTRGPRRIAILLDDFHTSPGINSARARAALLEFVNRSVRQDDVVYLMKPLDAAAELTPVRSIDDLRTTVARF